MHSLKSNPALARNLAGLLLLCALAAATIAFQMPDAGRGLSLQAVLGISGILVAPVALVFTLIKAVDAWQMRRLQQGKDVIARWRVCTADWQTFVQHEDQLDQQPDRRPNLLSYRQLDAGNGVEVIVGNSAVVIGGEFHALRKRGFANLYGPHWLPGSPACLQFDLTTLVSGNTHIMRWVLRLPVAGGAEDQAARVITHYKPATAAQIARNPMRSRNRALVGAAIGCLAFVVALMLRTRVEQQDLLAIVAVTGVIGAMACLILALFWHLQHQRTQAR